jgi:hypothetical protein
MDFSRRHFVECDPEARRRLCDALATDLLRRLRADSDFHGAVSRLVSELRAAGHDLWNFDTHYDEEQGFEVWCPDWTKEGREPGIQISFSRDKVDINWR